MAENEEVQNDGTWGSLKKTIIGTLSTLVLAGGTWLGTQIFGGGNDKEETKTEQAAPAPVINLNVDNSSKNTNSGGGTTTIIKEKVIEKAPATQAAPKEEKKSETEDAPW